MTESEFKKWCYKNNPVATFDYIKKGIAYYKTWTGKRYVHFSIPVADMGDAVFEPQMTAKHLIRWAIL